MCLGVETLRFQSLSSETLSIFLFTHIPILWTHLSPYLTSPDLTSPPVIRLSFDISTHQRVQSPSEFTKKGAKAKNLTLTPPPSENGEMRLGIPHPDVIVTITYTDCSEVVVKKEHNGRMIHKNNPTATLVSHRNAGHMCYTDDKDEQGASSVVHFAIDGAAAISRRSIPSNSVGWSD